MRSNRLFTAVLLAAITTGGSAFAGSGKIEQTRNTVTNNGKIIGKQTNSGGSSAQVVGQNGILLTEKSALSVKQTRNTITNNGSIQGTQSNSGGKNMQIVAQNAIGTYKH